MGEGRLKNTVTIQDQCQKICFWLFAGIVSTILSGHSSCFAADNTVSIHADLVPIGIENPYVIESMLSDTPSINITTKYTKKPVPRGLEYLWFASKPFRQTLKAVNVISYIVFGTDPKALPLDELEQIRANPPPEVANASKKENWFWKIE